MTAFHNQPYVVLEQPEQANGASGVLINLMLDTEASMLVALSEQYGVRRIPGLNKSSLIQRILSLCSTEQLDDLQNQLIAARYGSFSVAELIDLAVRLANADSKPRLQSISAGEAILLEQKQGRWLFTMRGHDVVIDTSRRTLSCDCHYFTFAAHRHGLCKHLALGFTLIPETYAHRALVDLLVAAQYGGDDTPYWRFMRSSAA